jgi:hypothetical protein
VNFYELGSSLIRQRRIPTSRRVFVELWNGTTWEPMGAADEMRRLGFPLNEDAAIQLMHDTRGRHEYGPFSDSEARHLLRAPGQIATKR